MKTILRLRWLMLVMIYCISIPIMSQRITLHNDSYQVLYNPKTNLPEVVEWNIKLENLGRLRRAGIANFKIDRRCPRPRATSKDFANSGYQRGHLCPSADFSAYRYLMRQTFVMSNVAPMVPSLNSGDWKATEIYCRQEAVKRGNVFVRVTTHIVGGDTTFIKGKHVAIPTHFRKQLWNVSRDTLLREWYFKNDSQY